jgi:hypothetical protein
VNAPAFAQLIDTSSLTPVEKETVLHLERVELYLKDFLKQNNDLGLSKAKVEALLKGANDSDKGKLAVYQKYFTENKDFQKFVTGNVDQISDASERYYAKLALMTAMKVVIQSFKTEATLDINKGIKDDLLKRMAYIQGKMDSGEMVGFLNKNITDFSKLTPIAMYMHALPGVWDAIVDASKGLDSEDDFNTRINTNFFHNGPHAGYWKILGEQFSEDIMTYTKGGLDNPLGTGNYYPLNTTLEGIVHTLFDRFEQATVVGKIKLFKEVSALPDQDGMNIAVSMLIDDVEKTQKQLRYISLVLEKSDYACTPLLKKLVKAMLVYTEQDIAFLDENVYVAYNDDNSSADKKITTIEGYIETHRAGQDQITRLYVLGLDGKLLEVANRDNISSDVFKKIYTGNGVKFNDAEAYLDEQMKVPADAVVVATSVAEDLQKLVDTGVASKEQIAAGVEALIVQANKEDNRGKANDLLTKAGFFNASYLDGETYTEITAKIKETVDKQEAKDKKLLTARINEYLGEEDGYSAALTKMTKQMLEMNCVVEGASKETLLVKILLGTEARAFKDAFFNQLKDVNAKVDSTIMFLFLGSNNNIIYEGVKYNISDVLGKLFSLNSFYRPSMLYDAYDVAKNTGAIEVMGKEFPMIKIFTKNVFRNVESLQKAFPIE